MVDYSIPFSDAVFKQAENYINSRKDVARTMAIVGGFGSGGLTNTVQVMITLVHKSERKPQERSRDIPAKSMTSSAPKSQQPSAGGALAEAMRRAAEKNGRPKL